MKGHVKNDCGWNESPNEDYRFMSVPAGRCRALALIIATLVAAPDLAAQTSSPLFPGSNSREPISIDADKLTYFDKEQKAIYTGNVVVIQGDSRLTATVMTIFLSKSEAPTAGALAKSASAPATRAGDAVGSAGSQVKHMDVVGPVTIITKTQVATGDRGAYDKDQNKVWLVGNVTLSASGNVTKGDELTYDLTTGEAVVEVGKTSARVHSQFISGSSSARADATDKSTAPKYDRGANATDKSKTPKKKVPADEAAPP